MTSDLFRYSQPSSIPGFRVTRFAIERQQTFSLGTAPAKPFMRQFEVHWRECPGWVEVTHPAILKHSQKVTRVAYDFWHHMVDKAILRNLLVDQAEQHWGHKPGFAIALREIFGRPEEIEDLDVDVTDLLTALSGLNQEAL